MENVSCKRLFVAIDPPGEIRREIGKWLRPLRAAVGRQARVSWVEPERLHLTIKFLGSTEPGRLPALGAALRELAAALPAFELAIRGAGRFPEGERAPRVLWLGVDDPEGRLARLAEALERQLEPLGFAREKRAFSAHLTIGRVRAGTVRPELLRCGETLRFGNPFDVRELLLYESRTLPSGPVYGVLERFALAQ
ncbi:MAG: RNA 2',3'-cyclic phosphodiesterase [Oligoflexia bacterium]|nr:RNA 2',3'-cyclic phosphodiesterase [Oligoflexia bacterium]